MERIKLDELDSFQVGIFQRVQRYKQSLDHMLAGYSDDGEEVIEQKTEISPIKAPMELSPVFTEIDDEICDSSGTAEFENENDDEINVDDSEQLANDNFVKNRRTAVIRKSIQMLLDVSLPLNDEPDKTENPIKSAEEPPKFDEEPLKPAESRLHQRLNLLSEKYKNCGLDDPALQPKKPQVLHEQNCNNLKPSTLKDRMNIIAQSYYPMKNATEPKKITSISKIVTRSAPIPVPQKSSTADLSKSMVRQPDKNDPPPKSSEPVVPKTSVADLKKLFEAKTTQSVPEELAPELLPLREKRRLFEKAIRQENAARANQYIKVPKVTSARPEVKISEAKSPDAKRIKTEDELEQPPKLVEPQMDDSKLAPEEKPKVQDSKLVQEEEPKLIQVEEKIVNEEQVVADDSPQQEIIPEEVVSNESPMKTESLAELTFTAIDNEEEQKDFERLVSEENVHRSSTRVHLKNSDSSLPPEKPPRLFLDGSTERIFSAAEEETVPKTVSFYHRQQKMKMDAQVANEYLAGQTDDVDTSQMVDPIEQFRTGCQEMMVALKEEISEHNRVLSQANTALKLSLSMPELKFSESRVEAERLLLVSTEKRAACLNEIGRLKAMVQDAQGQMKRLEEQTKGMLYISDIKIPFLNEFLVARANGKVANKYYFICLIYNGPNVFVSPLLDACKDKTKEALEFDLGFAFNDLNEDFKVVLKIFCLQLIIKEKRANKGTPLKNLGRRLKAGTNSAKSSPLTQQLQPEPAKVSIMSSNFQLVGYVPLTLKNVKTISNKFYRLDSECFRAIIDNYLTMNVAVKATPANLYHGYFDLRDSTFWNLRFFRLNGEQLQYWRFERDMEADQPALGTINLKHCINRTLHCLRPNQRQACARPNTFALITIDPPAVSNAKKLVHGGTITKTNPKIYFISSQTPSDCAQLCRQLNRTLRALRMWDTDVVQPYSAEEFDRILLKHY